MLTTIILALLALGTFTAIAIAVWTISALAEWVFGLFEDKDPEIDTDIVFPSELGQDVVGSLRSRGATSMADNLEKALSGAGNPKITIWGNGRNGQFKAKEINILSARDASVDEVNGVTRFERGGVIKQYAG